MKYDLLKQYYYDVVHWQVKTAIYHVRNNSYPVEYWRKELELRLKHKESKVQELALMGCRPGSQLSFVF
jgi:hypothetical protein